MAEKLTLARLKELLKYDFVGLFDTPEEAHTHWLQAARELHGDFARAA